MALETFKATAKILNKGFMVETTSREFKVIVDETEELGGSNEGMNPVELTLCALGACQSIVAKTFAKKFKIKLEEFWVELEGDLDLAGFMGDPNVRPGFQAIRYKMHMKCDATEKKAHEFADFIESRCPIKDSLQTGVELQLTGVVVE